jgi:heat shock protein HslJ
MRSFLRFSLFAFFALSTVLVFAQAKDTAKAKPKVGGPYLLINGEWELLSLRRLPADSFRIVYPNKIPSMLLQADKQMAYGQTGCNRFQGKATLTKDSVSFKQPMAMTMMACPGQGEKYFTQALQAVNKYAFKGGYLVMYQNSKEIMRFKRITTPPQPVKK